MWVHYDIVAGFLAIRVGDFEVENRSADVGGHLGEGDLESLVLLGVDDVDLPLISWNKDSLEFSVCEGSDVERPVRDSSSDGIAETVNVDNFLLIVEVNHELLLVFGEVANVLEVNVVVALGESWVSMVGPFVLSWTEN